MSKHFWPEPPPAKDHSWAYLVEHREGEICLMHLRSDGQWFVVGETGSVTTDQLHDNGYLGVRTPFSEEAERVEFEKVYGPRDRLAEKDRHDKTAWDYLLLGWLAAKRRERGIV